MTDPEETEREALAREVARLHQPVTPWLAFNIACRCGHRGTAVSREGDFEAHVASEAILAARRLSKRTVTEAYHDEVVGVAQRKIHELEGEVELLRLSESEIRRDQAEKDARIATRGLRHWEPVNSDYEPSPKIANAIRAQFTPSPEEPTDD